MFRFLINVLITLWLGFLVAAAIQVHRPASLADVQGLDAPEKLPAADVLDRIEQALWQRNAPLELGESEVNRHLATSLAGSQQYPSALLAKFDRVALSFKPGLCTVWLCWTAGGRSVTASLDFTVARDRQNFIIEPRGGSLGRLKVVRGALTPLLPGMRHLSDALAKEIHAVFNMNQIRFENHKVVLDPRFEQKK